MLGWALNKATGNASTDTSAPAQDDTFVEQPDTPAPVFAARAFKRAIFGTPAPTKETARMETKAGATKPENLAKLTVANDKNYDSPSKPQGILLTPGTGTTRRKRVSFGRDVKSNAALADSDNSRPRPRTKLQEALENSRKQKSSRPEEDDTKELDIDPDDDDADDAWEDLDRDADYTVDLNEPRSQSGQYWKGEFQKYHEEARAEMEKLVKYKQLAKSYAKAKDAEALDLNERLKEEQIKVVDMEKRIADLAEQISAKQGQSASSQDDRKLARDLTRQTALAVQYRNQVEELEALLKDSGYGADKSRRRRGGSPRSARDQTGESEDLRRELERVRSELGAAERRQSSLEVEKNKTAAELARCTVKVEDLERKLRKSEHDRQRKDLQYDKLKADYDALKEKSKDQKEEIANLRKGNRTSSSGEAELFKEDLKSMSGRHAAPSPWAKKLESLQQNLRDEQESRRWDMEDASITTSQLRQGFNKASELKSPTQRKVSHELGGNADDETTLDLLRPRVHIKRRQTEVPLGRPVSRGNKRKASGLLTSSTPGGAGKDDERRIIVERTRLPSLSDELKRMSSREPRATNSSRTRTSSDRDVGLLMNHESKSPSAGIETGKTRTRLFDTELHSNIKTAESTRAAISAERRAAAIARVEQKRAARKKAHGGNLIPDKENERP